MYYKSIYCCTSSHYKSNYGWSWYHSNSIKALKQILQSLFHWIIPLLDQYDKNKKKLGLAYIQVLGYWRSKSKFCGWQHVALAENGRHRLDSPAVKSSAGIFIFILLFMFMPMLFVHNSTFQFLTKHCLSDAAPAENN